MTASFPVTKPDTLDVEQARALTAAIRADLTHAVTGLRRAMQLDVPAALGYPHPWAWAESEFGDLLRELRLPRDVRLTLVDAMDGLPVRQIADRLGVSVGTVQSDRVRLGKVIPMRRPDPAPLPAPTGKLWEQAAEHLRRAGEQGLTLVELAQVMAISEGSASGLLSYLLSPRKRLAVRLETRRDGQRVHVAASGNPG